MKAQLGMEFLLLASAFLALVFALLFSVNGFGEGLALFTTKSAAASNESLDCVLHGFVSRNTAVEAKGFAGCNESFEVNQSAFEPV